MEATHHLNAVKQLRAIEGVTKEQIEAIPSKVKEGNEKHFNVIQVRLVNDTARKKYKAKVSVMAKNQRSFEKLKKNYAYFGIDHLILLHDPSEALAAEKKALAPYEKSAIEVEVDKELEKEMKEKREKMIAERTAKATEKKNKELQNGPGPKTPPPPKEPFDIGFDLWKADLSKVKDFAKENSIDLRGASKDSTIRNIVHEWLTKPSDK